MDKELSIKLLVDTKANRVLFAEAGKEVIDFLCSLLTLPISAVIKLLSKEQMVGCIGDFYSSLEQLDESYILSGEKKSALLNLNPSVLSTSISANTLRLTPPPFVNKKWNKYAHYCKSSSYNSYPENYITDVIGTVCPSCGHQMMTEVQYVGVNKGEEKKDGGELGFVKGVVTYIIMDDLSIIPMSTISSITFLNKFQIKDLGSLLERNVKLGKEEGLKLLKTSLQCKNVLTTLFLGEKKRAI